MMTHDSLLSLLGSRATNPVNVGDLRHDTGKFPPKTVTVGHVSLGLEILCRFFCLWQAARDFSITAL